MNPLISVIVPVYNCEEYLSMCLQSIVSQTYKNLEIILIDDGSTDGSGDICDQFQIIDKRIKVLHKKNNGVSNSRNLGIRCAMGDYISFVDADDMAEKSLFETLMRASLLSNTDIVVCKIKHCNKKIKLNNIDVFDTKKIKIIEKEEAFNRLFKGSGNEGYVVSKLYTKSLIQDVFFDEDIYIYEDQLFCANIFDKAKKICIYDEQLYNYRIYAASSLNQSYNERHLTSREACYRMRNFAEMKCPDCITFIDKQLFLTDLSIATKMAVANKLTKSNYSELKKELELLSLRDDLLEKMNKQYKLFCTGRQSFIIFTKLKVLLGR